MAWGDDAKLGSGLPDRFVFTIASAKIDHPYEKNPTQAALVLDGESNVDGELSDEHLWLKAGEQFESGDKEGTFWIHQTQTPDVYDDSSSKKKKLNKNSAYGKFLNSFIEVAGTDPLEANQAAGREKYQIWDVTFWQGMILDIEMIDEPYDFKDKDGNQVTGSSRQPYVRGFLGTGTATGAGETAAASASPAASAGSNNGTVDPKAYDSHMAYLESYVAAGGDTGDVEASKAYWEAARQS